MKRAPGRATKRGKGAARRPGGRKPGTARRRRNPPIVLLNPGAPVTFGKEVDAVFYEHVSEGPRVHYFGRGVRVQALPDGSIRLYHPRKRLWADL